MHLCKGNNTRVCFHGAFFFKMNTNPQTSSNTIHAEKIEPDCDNRSCSKKAISNALIRQKEPYEQEITRLKDTHNLQIRKLCNELENSSSMLHQYKLKLDSMRISLNIKEKQLKDTHLSNRNLQTQNTELVMENIKLKKELSRLTTEYQVLLNEVEDARRYILNKMMNFY